MVRAGVLLSLLLAGAFGGGAVRAQTPSPDDEQYREAARLAGAALADLEGGNLGRAQEGFELLSRLMPDNALPWINLAIVYLGLDRTADALEALERARSVDPQNAQLLYTEARVLEARAGVDSVAFDSWDRALRRLDQVDGEDPRAPWLRGRFLRDQRRYGEASAAFEEAHERSRDNLVILVDRLVAAASARDAVATGDALDALEDRLNGFDPALEPHAGRVRDAIAREASDALRPAALVLENLLRPSDLYQVGRAELEGREAGSMLFPQLEFVPPLPKSIQGGADIEIALRDETAGSGLAAALADAPVLDVEVRRELAGGTSGASGSEGAYLLLPDGLATVALPDGTASLRRESLAELSGAARAWSHDFDQDARDDLLVERGDELRLHVRAADGGLAAALIVASGLEPITALAPIDLDHDGDLDLLVGTGAETRLLQNRGAAGFVDQTAALGLPTEGGLTGIGAADLDEDGDLDLLLVYRERAPRLLLNRRGGSFDDASARWGLGSVHGAGGVVVADLDRNGRFDALLWGGNTPARVLRNTGGGFEAAALAPEPAATGLTAAAVGDLDNDGDLDLVAARDAELVLWRGSESGALAPEPAARLPSEAAELVALDLDGDGDLDLLARGADRRLTLLRNDGGNRNHWLRLVLRGLVDNNAKNNSEGLHALVEVRTGGAYQAALGNGGVNHFGLGARRQADVLRVVWTNGLAQTWQQLAAGQTLVEKQVLKGSCPLLYTWDGEDYGFVTDLMWRSTLGMRFGDGAAAPHQSARDWVLVPGSRLRSAGGKLWLQVTAELWETIYVDRQSLWAVDHPSAVEAVIDESFRPPPHPTAPPLHLVERWLEPSAARDHLGRDVRAKIAGRDGSHVDELPLTRYQGVTTGHELVLEFAHRPRRDDGALLVLWGWIFPTDTSINVALEQDPAFATAPPRLEALRADGAWVTLEPATGLPMGKRKAMVIELGPLLAQFEPEGGWATPFTLRLSTAMQIYWDAAAIGFPAARASKIDATAATLTRLEPASADLHYRGFSRLYRESATGPHLFDYRHSTVAPLFPPMAGHHTRYGAVESLLRREDDRYVVMAPGDELTVLYEADELPLLPPGFERDWVLYTDGWVKDADLNTRESATVEPLPYHGMTGYPEGAGSYPDDAETRRYLDEYQTRWLDARGLGGTLREHDAVVVPAGETRGTP